MANEPDEMDEWERVMAYADEPEIDRLAALSEEEFQAELAQERRERGLPVAAPVPVASSPRLDEAHSYDVSPASAFDKVASLADARAKRGRPVTSYFVYTAAAAIFGYAFGHQIGLFGDPHAADPHHPTPPAPSEHAAPTGSVAPTELTPAEKAKLVEEALGRAKVACDAKKWAECQTEINAAETLDGKAMYRVSCERRFRDRHGARRWGGVDRAIMWNLDEYGRELYVAGGKVGLG